MIRERWSRAVEWALIAALFTLYLHSFAPGSADFLRHFLRVVP